MVKAEKNFANYEPFMVNGSYQNSFINQELAMVQAGNHITSQALPVTLKAEKSLHDQQVPTFNPETTHSFPEQVGYV